MKKDDMLLLCWSILYVILFLLMIIGTIIGGERE